MSEGRSPRSSSELSDAIQALKENQGLEKLLKQKIPLNVRSSDRGETLLMLAIAQNRADLVGQLLKQRADLQVKASNGMTALHYCVKDDKANPSISRQLIAAKADVNATDKYGRPLLQTWTERVATNPGRTPLHLAVRCSLPITQQLLEAGANFHATLDSGQTALHLAAKGDSVEIVQALLQAKANVNANAKGDSDQTPLHFAVKAGSVQIVTALLEAKAHTNAKANSGQTALHIAAKRSSLEIMAALLAANADANAKADAGQTPLHVAAKEDSIEMVNVLLEAKANVNVKTNSGQTPLHLGVQCDSDDIRLVRCLLEAQAEVNAKGKICMTPLHFCVEGDRPKITALLLEKKADANAKTRHAGQYSGKTPLHFAASRNSVAVVDELLKGGADPRQKDDCDGTVLHDCARERSARNPEIASKLLKAKADVNASLRSNRETPLHQAAIDFTDSTLLVSCLLEAKANPNAKDWHHVIPLHRCVEENRPHITRLLLEKNANPRAKSLSLWTPLHSAILHRRQNPKVVRLLLRANANLDLYSAEKHGYTPYTTAMIHAGPAVIREITHQRNIQFMNVFLTGFLPKPEEKQNKCHLPEIYHRPLFDVNVIRIIFQLACQQNLKPNAAQVSDSALWSSSDLLENRDLWKKLCNPSSSACEEQLTDHATNLTR